MKAKTFVALTLVGSLSFAPLVGCGTSQATDQNEGEKAEEAQLADGSDMNIDEQNEQLAGGWTVNTDFTASLSEDERAIFEKASAEYVGVGFEPVTVLATQLVSGTNYAFLCQATTVTATPTTYWAVVVVYNDLDGNASITNVEDIELADIDVAEADDQDEDVVGGWTVRDPSNTIALPLEANDAFGKASENYTGVALTPMALLGTQVVAGANYLVLCQGNAVTQNPQQKLYLATVYEGLDGNAEFTNVSQFDLLEYVS